MITNIKDTHSKIIFFFPYRELGGVPIVFLELAKFLSDSIQCSYQIAVVDYEDGYMAKNIGNSNIEFIRYSSSNELTFGNKDIVIFQSLPLWMIPKNLAFSFNTKFFFWNLHPLNLIPYLQKIDEYKISFLKKPILSFLKYFLMQKEMKTIKLFSSYKAISFMDKANFEQTKQLQNFKHLSYLPLPININMQSQAKTSISRNKIELNLAWVGRIVDFKVHILIHLLERLPKISDQLNCKFNFYIVGNGPMLDFLKMKVSNLNINLHFIDSVSRKDLPNFLKTIDIGFAQGMTAIDFANNSVPTVLCGFSYKPIKRKYHFKWLKDSKGFNLGEDIKNYERKSDEDSLKKIIHSVIDDIKISSQESYEYVKNNHSIFHVSTQFLIQIGNSSLRYKNVPSNLFKIGIITKILGGKPGWQD